MKVRTRFAPSPTGYMHVGGIRTALFAWLVARQVGGEFVLRIEDTDKNREVEGSAKHIQDCLTWLGLNWDEGPFFQSQRLDIYKKWASKLIERGRAYADTHTPEELDTLRDQAKSAKKPFLFRDHRPLDPPEWDGTQPLRFKSEPKIWAWRDAVLGELEAGPEAADDFILIKSDGFPTYNFAHIVDDHLMGITHVIRSQEFLPSVPKFLDLYEALEIKPPILATLPYVLGPDGKKKLSKRDSAKDILDYKKEGYLPEALLNFLATLGWNDGSKQEIFGLPELVKSFDLSRVQKSGAHFDEQRLIWINGHYIRELPTEKLAGLAEDFWSIEAKHADQSYKLQVLELVQERLKFLAELPDLTRFFFADPADETVTELFKNPVDKKLEGLNQSEIKAQLEAAMEVLATSDFDKSDITKKLNDLLDKLNSSPGVLFATIRIAVTGSKNSPEIFGLLSLIGRERSLERISRAIELLS